MDTFFTKWNALSPVCLLEIAKSKPRKYWLAKMAKLTEYGCMSMAGLLGILSRSKGERRNRNRKLPLERLLENGNAVYRTRFADLANIESGSD